MSNSPVKLEVRDNGVAVITLDVQDSKVNSLSGATMAALDAAVASVAGNPSVKGLVITSGKADSFVAGADIPEIRAIQSQEPVKAYEASKLGKDVFARIDALPIRVVAAINGICLGGGTELTLACDVRLASGSPKTKIGLPEVNLGFIPGWGGCVRMPLLIGVQAALDLILTGKNLDAKRAWKVGLVDEVVDPARLLDRAVEVALGASPKRFKAPLSARLKKAALEGNPLGRKIVRNIATKTVYAQTKGNYPAPLEALKVVFKAVSGPRDKAFEAESQAFGKLAVSSVSKHLVSIFFAQQDSKKTGDVVCNCPIETVGVMGAGVMGAGIAQAAAFAGYKVVLYDKFPQALERGKGTIKGLFDGLVEKRKLTREEADAMVANITFTGDYSSFADCDFVIEAILEDMKIKKDALADLEKVVKNDCFIFATNTSSLSVTTMSEDALKPSNVVGVHFFNPVHKMPLVEIVRGKHTSREAVACAKSFAMKLGKTTVETADAPGFVVNRILAPYLREAILLMEQGVPMEDIERAMTKFGMPMGPLALLDEVGLDICGKVIEVLHEALGDRLSPPAILAAIKAKKLVGKKGGKGIYLYDEKTGKRAGFNPEVVSAITAPRAPKSLGEIQDRLVLAMVNEAVRCLEEGVVEDPAQLDLAMIFGCGFPPFRGGVLRYADEVGSRVVHQKLEYLSRVAGDNYKPAALLTTVAASGATFTARS